MLQSFFLQSYSFHNENTSIAKFLQELGTFAIFLKDFAKIAVNKQILQVLHFWTSFAQLVLIARIFQDFSKVCFSQELECILL